MQRGRYRNLGAYASARSQCLGASGVRLPTLAFHLADFQRHLGTVHLDDAMEAVWSHDPIRAALASAPLRANELLERRNERRRARRGQPAKVVGLELCPDLARIL
jgi:hypothetical protein